MSTVGFLGLGSMGQAMAHRLVAAGLDVVVWNRSAEKATELVAAGARLATEAAEALAADVSFSMLANDAAADAVLSEEVVAGLAGKTHVMMASITPELSERLAERFAKAGANYIAAPVLGRPEVAAAGQLNILAAGNSEVIDQVTPLLEVMGKRVWKLAEKPEVANSVKAAMNYNIIHALQAMGESVAMTERVGVDPELFIELLTSTFFGGVVYSVYGDLIAKQKYHPPAFTVALGRKDLSLAEGLAKSTGVKPATLPALIEVFDAALADPELADGDWSAIAEISRRQGR